MNSSWYGKSILIAGITDRSSLALAIARHLQQLGVQLICTGLGETSHHANLSEKSAQFLRKNYEDFTDTVAQELGPDVQTAVLDVTLDGSVAELAEHLRRKGTKLDGIVHAVAMDKTIRGGFAKNLLDVTREEFAGAMDVSAYSLIVLTRSLIECEVLAPGASVLSLSYLGASRVMTHPYKNIGVAKSALERITLEMAQELGLRGIRVNAIRFSPYAVSKAGAAIPGLAEAVASCDSLSPLGNARPEDLARAAAFLLSPDLRITGQILHVDGGYSIGG